MKELWKELPLFMKVMWFIGIILLVLFLVVVIWLGYHFINKWW